MVRNEGAPEIIARELSVRVGRGTPAVRGLDLDLGRGVHGLLGPNGAGKTTLIRTLATVLRPATGELIMLGKPVGRRPDRALRRDLGYLPQEFGYYKRFTVAEFVGYVAWLKQMPAAGVRAAVRWALERVGLGDRAGARLGTLSGGMVRRAGIAQAIVNRPRVLLLDEPTVGLDPAQRLQFRQLMQELGADCCVLVSTHLVEDVAAACGNVLIMSAGKVVFEGPPGALAEAGAGHHHGDSPMERGYTALLNPNAERGAW